MRDKNGGFPVELGVADHRGHHAALADAGLVANDEAFALANVVNCQGQRLYLLGRK